ncbi:MAG: Hsp20/alpha crystallin family protein [Thermomicrobiales bacterium]|nr:Hsp20/alpha crystallin family protein [Thermomicrobiales bacterium]
MRYRRWSYRYALVLSGGSLQPLGLARPGSQVDIGIAQASWRPPADVYETAGAIVVTVELAGVDEDAIDVALFEDALVVAGQRRLALPEGRGVYHVADIRQGPFRLELPLPAPVDADRVDAHYDRGLLRITLGKSEAR